MEKKRKEKGRKSAWKKVMLAVIIIPVLIAIIALCAGMIILHTGDEEIDEGKLNFTSANLKITDNSGQYVDLPEKYDKFATSEEIPDILKKAFVALEDKRFYIHHGVDYLRVAKAAVNNIAAGGIKEGASTITQQLIKNTHLTAEKSFKRKLTEARLALKLEKQYSKDEILTMYLNMLYFGSGEYGVKNAAYRFFGKELSELNTAECAMLTGIVKSPTKYNPINNYYNSMERTDLVLNVMCKEGVISEYERDKAKNTDIIIKNQVFKNNSAFYFLEYSIKECCEIMNITPEQLTQTISIDCELCFHDINADLLYYLRLLNPFGPGNQRPIFVTRNVLDYGTSKLVGRNLEHIKLELIDNSSNRVMNGIAFNQAENFACVKAGKPFEICYTIEENRHKGGSSIQLFVKEIRAINTGE